MGTGTGSSSFAGWLHRHAVMVGLLRDTNYRRNVLTIYLLNLRRALGWRMVLAFFFFPLMTWWLVGRFAQTELLAADVVLGVFAAVALGLGATLFTGEQQSGTLELLWLATGSERSLFRFKMLTSLSILALMAVPALLLVGSFPLLPQFATGKLLFLILTNGFFILATLALITTWLRQPWAAGLLGLVIFAGWFTGFHESKSVFYLFVNPQSRVMQNGSWSLPISALLPNRFVLMGFAFFILRMAEKRLRRIF
jgi:hypothetical protein